jgi:hypothetical protein
MTSILHLIILTCFYEICHISNFPNHQILLSTIFSYYFSLVQRIIIEYTQIYNEQNDTHKVKIHKITEKHYSKYTRVIAGMIISYGILYANKAF